MEKDSLKKDHQNSKGVLEPSVMPIFIPQGIFGMLFTSISFYIGYYHGDFILPTTGAGNMHLSARLAYALCCSFPMLLSLYAGVQVIGTKRALTGAVNPLAGNERLVQVDKNYLTNTLEQFVLGLTFMLIVAAYADSPQVLRLLPLYSAVFMIARISFWVGYSISPFYRTTGISMSFCSSYIMLGMISYYTWTKGPAAVLGNTLLLSETIQPQGHQEL